MKTSFLKIKKMNAALLCFGLIFSVYAQAQDARIAAVNSERIMRDSNQAKAAQTKLEREFSKRDKELQEMAARLKSIAEKHDKDAAITSEAERIKRQRDLVDMDREFQRKQREFREDLNQRRSEELSAVLERANGVIRQFAEQKKYDLIVQEAVYVSPRIDVTDEIIKILNASK